MASTSKGDELYVMPILHPSGVMRGRWAMSPIQTIILTRAWAYANGDIQEDTIDEGRCNYYPTEEELYDWWKWYGKTEGCTVDIECAGPHLLVVGLCSLTSEHYVCVRFRSRLGALCGNLLHLRSSARFLSFVLSDPKTPKVFHNGQAFDIPYLEDMGFVVDGYDNDTMLQAHLTYAEHPKGLEFLASIYADMPPWKHLVREEKEPEGK